jgi:hypothetical protein
MRATGKRKAPASPQHRQPQKRRSSSVANEDESALHEIFKGTTDIRLPADAHVVGEPVTVTQLLRPSGVQGVRAGLFAACERNGVAYEVSLADVVFAAGSSADALVARYRTWLGLAPPTGSAVSRSRPHKVIEGDVVLGTPTDLVVLACRSNALHCRMLGGSRVITLRTAVRDEVPGAIITVVPTKQWTHARHPYITGEIAAMRFDGQALALPLLALRDEGEWDPEDEYWGEEGEPLEPWAKAIIARGTRPMVEMEQVIPGADPEDWDSDPITKAADLRESGDVRAAYKVLMDLLARDLRCLDAHAHLGNLEFDHSPKQALRHYEMGMTIGALSLGKEFDGVLPWGLVDNRPFLRCLHGVGIANWRLGDLRVAQAAFTKMLWLNPGDNQGARFCLAAMEAGKSWDEMA